MYSKRKDLLRRKKKKSVVLIITSARQGITKCQFHSYKYPSHES